MTERKKEKEIKTRRKKRWKVKKREVEGKCVYHSSSSNCSSITVIHSICLNVHKRFMHPKMPCTRIWHPTEVNEWMRCPWRLICTNKRSRDIFKTKYWLKQVKCFDLKETWRIKKQNKAVRIRKEQERKNTTPRHKGNGRKHIWIS